MPLPPHGTQLLTVFLDFALIASVAGLGGCDLTQDESGPPGEPVSYDWVTRGYGTRVYEAQTRVFRDSLTWVQFWDEHVNLYDQNHEAYPAPSVDFDRRIIIGVYWGHFYSGCQTINRIEAIEGIYDAGNRIVVDVGPVPDLGACRLLVYPTQVVSIPRPDKPVEFTGKVPEQRYEPARDSNQT